MNFQITCLKTANKSGSTERAFACGGDYVSLVDARKHLKTCQCSHIYTPATGTGHAVKIRVQ